MCNSKNSKLEEILNELKNKDESLSAQELLLSKLTPEQSEKLKGIISDDEAIKNFLSSDKAREIIKKLAGKDE